MTQADIIRFAAEFDPQPMHIDAEAAAAGVLAACSQADGIPRPS